MATAGNEQIARWRGRGGTAWADLRAVIDGMYRPLEELLLDGDRLRAGAHVLDVGCGTGSTTVALARRVGAGGRALGVDIAEPMIAAARARAAEEGSAAEFVLADAQEEPLPDRAFDAVVSRFGVMFFADPVRAFANLRSAAKDDAVLRLVVWRTAAENPFMTTAERAAAPLLPAVPVRRPDEPGQFAFGAEATVRHVLSGGGWRDVDVRPVDVPLAFPADRLEDYFTRLGPVGAVLPDADDATRAEVVRTLHEAFAPFVHGADVRLTAACWLVDARA